MNKKELGTEIEALINSLKTLSDNVMNEVRIPTFELELITSTIRTLHEKSIIFNHLHYLEEQQEKISSIEKENQLDENETVIENFIINASEIPTPIAQPIAHEAIIPTVENSISNIPETIQTIAIKPESAIEQTKVEPKVEPTIIIKEETILPEKVIDSPIIKPAISTEIIGKDLKKIIGFSDKYYFISQLFAGNADDFNSALQTLNYCKDQTTANQYLVELEKQKSWAQDNEAYTSIKRYITNKYN